LICNTLYYYRVRAFRAGDGQFSSYSNTVNALTVGCPPTPLAPPNGHATTDRTPTFSWGAVPGAAQYRLQVDDHADFTSPVIKHHQVGTTHTPSTNLADASYSWRVQASVGSVWARGVKSGPDG